MANKQTIFPEAIGVLERLEVTEGRIDKEELLRQYRGNKALQTIIKMALGTDRYFVRPGMNIVCLSTLKPLASWHEFVKLTRRLKNREITGTEAKLAVERFLASCRPILMKWYCRILNHDLRIGVDRLTVQKIWDDRFLLSNSVNTVRWRFCNVARAKTYDPNADKPKVQYPAAVEPKLDGERAPIICFPRDNEVIVLTRSGRRRKPIEGVAQFTQQVVDFCKQLNEGDDDRPVFLDGEFLARNFNRTGLVRRTTNFDADKFLAEVRLYLWDWMPLDRYLAGSFDLKWTRRKAMLLRAAGAKGPTEKPVVFSPNIVVLGHKMVYDQAQLLAEYERLVDKFEGVIVKVPYAPHTLTRSAMMLKLKPETEVSGRIVGYYAGEKQHAAIDRTTKRVIIRLMRRAGETKVTKQYIFSLTKKPADLVAKLKEAIRGDNEHRIFFPKDGIVGFRHGKRLGGFIVELDDGKRIWVGGGYSNDERERFWRHRKQYLGMYVDVLVQDTETAEASGRFNRFKRLREDL